MNSWHAVLYGLIQGFSEFVPVSSSGHLALLPFLLEIEDPGLYFDLCLHVGTAFAVIIYFRSQLSLIYQNCLALIKNPKDYRRISENQMSLQLLMSTGVSVIAIFALMPLAKFWGRSESLIAFNLIFFGLLLFIADRFQTRYQKSPFLGSSSFFLAIMVGLAQSIAIFPGVSRSGITLTMSRFLGVSRYQAAEFSFLLSLPIILMGAAYHSLEIVIKGDVFPSLWHLSLGVLVSFLVGYTTIHFFLTWMKHRSLTLFAFYRVILAGVILLLVAQSGKHLF